MSDDVAWDADDYEPLKNTAAVPKITDKWEGEDEDDEVKDNWDDEEEEKSSSETSSKPTKTKKKLADIIAEKEAKRVQEIERRILEKEAALSKNTPEEQLAEKIRIQKIKEESDLQIAEELLSVAHSDHEEVSLDSIDISTNQNLERFKEAILNKIRSTERLEKRPFYVVFVEDLVKDLCLNLDTDEVKKISTVLNTVYNEKVKASKQNKGKKKAANKAKLNAGQGDIADSVRAYDFDDYDDFI